MTTCNCDNCNCNEITLDAGYETGMMVINGGSSIDITIDDVLSFEFGVGKSSPKQNNRRLKFKSQ